MSSASTDLRPTTCTKSCQFQQRPTYNDVYRIMSSASTDLRPTDVYRIMSSAATDLRPTTYTKSCQVQQRTYVQRRVQNHVKCSNGPTYNDVYKNQLPWIKIMSFVSYAASQLKLSLTDSSPYLNKCFQDVIVSRFISFNGITWA